MPSLPRWSISAGVPGGALADAVEHVTRRVGDAAVQFTLSSRS